MATASFVQIGENIDFTASEDIEYMEIVPLKTCIGIAMSTIAKGATGTLSLTGVYDIPAATGALAVGDAVYFDVERGSITATKASNVPAGIAVLAKAESGTTARVRIG